MSKPTPSSSGALHKLYQKQQPKLGAKRGTSKLLTTFAEDDYQRIAALIAKWLEESEKPQRRRSQRR
ncbi:hypothetical protein HMF8227_01323 [Saliniradius amylolyticus]|uniref:Uncharacterized protein n=1 Tax=Saliniradius amylolyticus TaxID=2183582 RepID=A0A2S2E2C9_9ALTE|nr:hypothetical protein [Saliniradius amylolyticus]AWL11801.1 hypothetical protein HMF8227_01323 [Saliniradius amylolyticus]